MRKARMMILTGLAALACGAAFAVDWPQPGCNPQHTSFTPDSPAPPYMAAWVADFTPEQIYSAQPVIADGRLFQTTLQGNLYALDTATGQRLWHFKAGDVIWSAAAAGTPEWGGAGKVFLAAWEGIIYGLDAATGKELWRYDAMDRISGAPCVAEDTVFIGTRRGTMLALSTDGALKWKIPLSWHIYSTAAWNGGRVYVVTEDLYVHCLDAKTGKPLWKSDKLQGMLMREFYPVIHKGKVLVSLTPAVWRADPGGPPPFLMPWGGWKWSDKQMLEAMNKYSKAEDANESGNANAARASLLRGASMPQELEEAQQALLEYYRENPEYQTFYVLNESDGNQPFIPVHHYTASGLENLNAPAAVMADGNLAKLCIFGGSRVAVYNLEKNRWVDFLLEFEGSATDNVEYLSVGGNRLFSKNWIRGGHGQRAGFVMDMDTHMIAGTRNDAQLKKIPVSVMPREWRPFVALSPNRLGQAGWGLGGTSPAPIAGNRFYWIKNNPNELICFEGK